MANMASQSFAQEEESDKTPKAVLDEEQSQVDFVTPTKSSCKKNKIL